MKISAVKDLAVLAKRGSVDKVTKAQGKTFKEVFEGLINGLGKTDFHKEMATLQHSLKGGKHLAPRELLLYQIKAGQFGLRVELVSKLAESAVSTLRKFQGNQ